MVADWFDLQGRVALVTGGSKGLGRTIAGALAAAGADVILASRTAAELEATAAELHAATGRHILPLCADVTQEDSVRDLVGRALEAVGRIDILVNNAGIGDTVPVVELETAEWDRVMNVNVRGPMLCCKHLGPHLLGRGSGKVINVASVMASRVARHMAPYCTSKAALVQFTRALALEWIRHGVQVNALCPGYFLTDINRDFFASERGARFVQELPMRRLGEARELEGAAVFLASDASNYVTGTELYVDGGHRLA